MPARREIIRILPEKMGRPGLVRDFPSWWDRGAFFESFKARELDLGNPVDWNLAWLLSGTEAVLWDERCRTSFPRPRLGDPAGLEADMCALAEALREASWVVVESREWESGLE
jgi:hypothetical protein